MTRLRVLPIVEGHGETAAVPILIRRIWLELLHGEYVEVLKPIRGKRNLLVKEETLCKAVELGLSKLSHSSSSDPSLLLVLVDRDPDPEPPCVLGPRMLKFINVRFAHANAACVIANLEYETWFAAAAESLHKYLRIESDSAPSFDPEGERHGKRWIAERFKGIRYSETQDQPALTAAMDLHLCRARSPSFDKLCRDLEAQRAGNPAS